MDQMINLSHGLQTFFTLNLTGWSQVFLCPGQPLPGSEPGEYKAYGWKLQVGLRTETGSRCSAQSKS